MTGMSRGVPLTQASIDKSRTPAVRDKANRTRLARSPLTWLKRQVVLSKMPHEVRARVEKLFEDMSHRVRVLHLDEQEQQREAYRLAALIHWTRATHRLLNMDPGEPGYMTVSKVVSQMTLIERKLNGSSRKQRDEHKGRKQVPTAARGHAQDEHQGEPDSDGETA